MNWLKQIYTDDGHYKTLCIPIGNKGWFKMELQYRSCMSDRPYFKLQMLRITKTWVRGTNVAWYFTLFLKCDWSSR